MWYVTLCKVHMCIKNIFCKQNMLVSTYNLYKQILNIEEKWGMIIFFTMLFDNVGTCGCCYVELHLMQIFTSFEL